MISRKIVLLPLLTLAAAACSQEDAPAPDPSANDPVAAEEDADAAAMPVEPVANPYPPAEQVGDIALVRVSFEPGASSATVDGSIQGYETVDYVVNARAGQAMRVALDTAHTATYFNLLEPGETDVATHIGSTAGNLFEGTTEKTGDYRIRVYMMRSAARREETADYTIDISIG